MSPSPHTPTPTITPGRVMLRDIGAGAASTVQVTFDVRTAFDFAISLANVVGEHDELPEEDRRWLEKGRASLPEAVRKAASDEMSSSGATLIVDRPEVTDAASFVELLRGTSGREFAAAVLADDLRDPARKAEIAAAAAGDPEALRSVLECGPDYRAGLAGATASATRTTWSARSRSSWPPGCRIYQEMEPRIRKIIERDVELRAGDRAALGATELIERTTSGVRWLSEPGLRRVVLAPSYLVRPYNFTFASGDWRMFVYPVADEALEPHDPLAPPVSVLRLHRALGDDSRLRILRLLRDRDWYLTEIAERLELSKPTIKHHLAQLRAAGLVTLTEEGGLSYYSLRRDRLDDASSELKRYLRS